MLTKSNRHWLRLAGMSLALALTACTQLAPPVAVQPPARTNDQQQKPTAEAPAVQTQPRTAATPTAAPTKTAQSNLVPAPKTVAVRRGTISQDVSLTGHVSGTDETPLSFGARTVVTAVGVKPGDTVTTGQMLVQSDTTQLASSLADARDRLDASLARVDLARRQAADRDRQSAVSQQDAVATATESLRKAQDDQAKIDAGASDIEKQTADAAVATASAALQKAQSQYAKLASGASQTDVIAAQQAVAAADLAEQQAEADLQKLQKGPDPSDVRTAQQQLADAQTVALSAKAALDRLVAGPDEFELRAAQRVVDRAQANLDAANAMSATAGANKAAAVASAKFSLQDAQDALAKLKQAATPEVLAAAKTKVDDANTVVANAQDKLTNLTSGPDRLAIAKATAAVEAAKLNVQNAQAKLNQVKAGASQDDLDTAQAALSGAQLSLNAAQAKRDDVYARPTQAERDDAKRKVDAAQTALSRAMQGQLTNAQTTDQAQADVQLQKDRQAIDKLQAQLDAASLRAPFDGRVVSVQAVKGETIEGGEAAVVVARSGDPIVLATLSGPDTRLAQTTPSRNPSSPRSVAAGQQVTVRVDGGDGATLTGSVENVIDGPQPNARTAQIQVDWGSTAPAYGSTALVDIKVGQKRDALLVPASAVQTAGQSKYIEYLVGSERKIQPVEVGITTDTDVEIISGLSDGQLIIAGSGSAGTATSPTAVSSSGAASSSVTPTATGSASGGLASSSPPAATPASRGSAAASPILAPLEASLLDEDFSSNTRGWISDPLGTAWIDGGAYHLAARTPAEFVSIGAPPSDSTTSLGDVQVSGVFRKTGGPAGGGYGLIMRNQAPAGLDGRNQTGAYYVFEVSDLGQVGIWRRDQDRWRDILPWTHSDAVVPGTDQINRLTVSAIGSTLKFDVNDVNVATKTDTTLTSGGVGIFVGGDLNEVSVSHFSVQRP